MEKTLVVNTENGDVTVKKLALREYGELLRALQDLPKEFGKLLDGNSVEDLKGDQLYQVLPGLLGTAVDESARILATVTDKDEEFIANLDLAEAIDILVAALELNDYKRIVASVKKIMAPKRSPPIPAGK